MTKWDAIYYEERRTLKIDGKRVITMRDVAFFRHRTYIGARMRCMILDGEPDNKAVRETPAECVILHKGKHVAVTDQGTMQWTLLTIWNIGLLTEWEKEDRERRRWEKMA